MKDKLNGKLLYIIWFLMYMVVHVVAIICTIFIHDSHLLYSFIIYAPLILLNTLSFVHIYEDGWIIACIKSVLLLGASFMLFLIF